MSYVSDIRAVNIWGWTGDGDDRVYKVLRYELQFNRGCQWVKIPLLNRDTNEIHNLTVEAPTPPII